MVRAAAVSEMSGPCAISGDQLGRTEHVLSIFLFFLESLDVHVKMWPPEAPDLPVFHNGDAGLALH